MNAVIEEYPTIASLGLDRLSAKARARLANELLESLPPIEEEELDIDSLLSPEEQKDLAQALVDWRTDPGSFLTREEADQELQRLRSISQ